MAQRKKMVREPVVRYDGVVDPNGRIVLPAEVRRRLGLAPGDGVVISVEQETVRVVPRAVAVKEAQAAVRQRLRHGASLVDELLEMRSREARRG